jgi:deoxyribodipyrimidine photo-lyase
VGASNGGVPRTRIRRLGDGELRADGAFVLYWMIAARRVRWNYGLERAVELARELGKPLVVLEALRVGYAYASDRLHRFVIDGMRANERLLDGAPVLYHPYVEPEEGAGKGLLKALAADACAVVTDDWPCFFQPAMLRAAERDVHVRFEAVDSNGLLPIRSTGKAFARAFDLRRFLQRELEAHLAEPPKLNPLARVELPRLKALPTQVRERWPRASAALLDGDPAALAAVPIDHAVGVVGTKGGAVSGERALKRFLDERLARYGERNDPAEEATSGLSPYLHFGHVAPHQVLDRLASHEGWTLGDVTDERSGKREGWWGMSAPAEGFMDQLATWRELGLNACVHMPDDYKRWSSLPDWARATLTKHADDERPFVYTKAQLEDAETHDEIWNAAQNQLRRDGVIHNYLRMLWGKKILHWTRSPRTALDVMLELNDRYALDGRDPNSYSGIFWTLGRHDRPWGPEREVFGTVRYMSSDSTRRKLHVNEYVRRYGAQGSLFDG